MSDNHLKNADSPADLELNAMSARVWHRPSVTVVDLGETQSGGFPGGFEDESYSS